MVDDFVHRLSAQLVLAPAEHPRCRGIHERQTALPVEGVNPFGHLFHHGGAEVCRLFALGDIEGDDLDAHYLAADADRVEAAEPVPSRSSRPRAWPHDFTADYRNAGFEHAPVDRVEFGPDLRNDLGHRAPNLVRDGPAVDRGKRGVDVDDAKLAIDERKSDRGGRLQCLQQRQRFSRLVL